ncbi:hypothetical protein EJB05_50353 [Eragrostis curvula]|uniref:Uncharacterized protein n=1 Tax=Eragrostis curvula TaxID=38414 RepID=A0A5J9SYI4_9POAL|nr:hypothetical protein EJB05_50353 [Eragrostis curvula]
MPQTHPEPGAELPPPGSPPPASQGGRSDGGAEADVASSMEDVLHVLVELKESVIQLNEEMARMRAQSERWNRIK